ncbi:MAG: hypothetical protein WC683_04460 [bacterium]
MNYLRPSPGDPHADAAANPPEYTYGCDYCQRDLTEDEAVLHEVPMCNRCAEEPDECDICGERYPRQMLILLSGYFDEQNRKWLCASCDEKARATAKPVCLSMTRKPLPAAEPEDTDPDSVMEAQYRRKLHRPAYR